MPANASARLAEQGATLIPATRIAEEAGSAKAVNVVLLGALSTRLPFSEEAWRSVIEQRVPSRTVAINLAAFEAGRAFARA